MSKKIKTILTLIIILILIIIGIILYFVLREKYRPRTDAEKLSIYQTALNDSSAELMNNVSHLVSLYQDGELKTFSSEIVHFIPSGSNSIGLIVSSKGYPSFGHTYYDNQDEFFLYQGINYLQRVTDEETVTYQYDCTDQDYLRLIQSRVNPTYFNLDFTYFVSYSMEDLDNLHRLTVIINPEFRDTFLGEIANELDLENIEFIVELDGQNHLTNWTLSYDSDNSFNDQLHVIIARQFLEPVIIIIPEWVKVFLPPQAIEENL